MNYKQLLQIDKSKMTFGGIMLIGVAIVFVWIRLEQPKINSLKDLNFIKGQFRDYDFSNHGGKNSTNDFRLIEYTNSFRIKADFLGGFRRNNFRNLQYGDSLTITISPSDVEKLNKHNNFIFVFSITDKNSTFLDPDFTIRKNNSNFAYYLATLFFLIGSVWVYNGLKWRLEKAKLVNQ